MAEKTYKGGYRNTCCKKDCLNKIPQQEVDKFHHNYRSCKLATSRAAFIAANVNQVSITGQTRNFHNYFRIRTRPVCRLMFCKALGISNNSIIVALDKCRTGFTHHEGGCPHETCAAVTKVPAAEEEYLELPIERPMKLELQMEPEIDDLTCGACLEMAGAAIVGPEYHQAFRTVTGFDTTNEFLCHGCIEYLDGFFNYRDKVQEKHRSSGYEPSVCQEDPETPTCPHCFYTSHSPGQLRKHIASVHQMSAQEETPCSWIKTEQDDVFVPDPDFDPIKPEIKTELDDEASAVTAETQLRFEISQVRPGPTRTKEKSDTAIDSDYLKCKKCNQLVTPEELFEIRKQLIESSKHLYKSNWHRKKPQPQHDDHVTVSCPICSKQMKKSRLKGHILCHTKKFLCHYCSKSFVHPSHLRYHLNEHEGTKPFQCDLCEFTCNTKGQISNHIRRIHLGNADLQCPICKRNKFTKKINLEDHMAKYHPGGKDNGMRVNPETNFFDCPKCGGSFYLMKYLIKHDCVPGKRQLRCTVCKKPCKNREKMIEHIRKAHRGAKG